MAHPAVARLFALVILAVVLVSLAAQFAVSLAAQFAVSQALMGNPGVTATLWRMAGYFTVLSNVGVAGIMAAVVLGWRPGAGSSGAMTLAIVMVGIVYHLILARLWAPEGLAWWADQGLHTAVPLLTMIWWLAFAPKAVGPRDLPGWLIWPGAYAGYALIRGASSGFWPYPFLDAAALGWPQVALNVAGLVAAFAALGVGLILMARRSAG